MQVGTIYSKSFFHIISKSEKNVFSVIETFVECALLHIRVIDLNYDLIDVENWHPKAE